MVDKTQKKKPNFLYFIEAGQHIKIGITSNPAKRIKAVQTGYPLPCVYLAIFDCGRRAANFEYKMHEIFKDDKSHGEWFYSTDEMKEFIRDSLNSESLKFHLWEEKYNSVYYTIGDELECETQPDCTTYLDNVEFFKGERLKPKVVNKEGIKQIDWKAKEIENVSKSLEDIRKSKEREQSKTYGL